MMHVDYLIVGQGICGTWLSYFLRKENKSFLVIDVLDPGSASRVAAGIINPVTGRRHVTVWMADEVLPFSWDIYQEIGTELGITAISHKNIIDFFPSAQMLESFVRRIEENGNYVYTYPEQNHFNPFFNYDFGCGEIRPVYIVHLEKLLPSWREKLKGMGCLKEENFDIEQLKITENRIEYGDISAEKIIFCDGVGGFENPFFNLLPFAPSKGEALLLDIPDLPQHHTYKKGMHLVPLQDPGKWWVGSSYEWEFSDPGPTQVFYEKTSAFLKHWLKLPYTITDHLSSVRPATLERRPFVGLHPWTNQVGILNGMGTKGCSLAPLFAKELTEHLVYHQPIRQEADIRRFSKVLSRN